MYPLETTLGYPHPWHKIKSKLLSKKQMEEMEKTLQFTNILLTSQMSVSVLFCHEPELFYVTHLSWGPLFFHHAHTDWAQYTGPGWAMCQMTPSKWTVLRLQMWLLSSQSLAFGTVRIPARLCFIASCLLPRCRRQLRGPFSKVLAAQGCQAWRINVTGIHVGPVSQ